MLHKPFFDPWVGIHFGNSKHFGTDRILGLGHFHYGWPEPCATQKVVGSHCHGDYSEFQGKRVQHRLFAFGANILCGVDESELRKAGKMPILDHIAFCNFVQRSTAGPKEKPTAQDRHKAMKPFQQILQDLDPHVVLVFSGTVSSFLKPFEKRGCFGDRKFVWGRHPQGCSKEKQHQLRCEFLEFVPRAQQGAGG